MRENPSSLDSRLIILNNMSHMNMNHNYSGSLFPFLPLPIASQELLPHYYFLSMYENIILNETHKSQDYKMD